MLEVRQTLRFRGWLAELADQRARERIAQRIVRISAGLLGDVKSVGGSVSELRVDYGPGYRVYFTKRGKALIVLLCAGDKCTQKTDIATAQAMAKTLMETGDDT